MHNWYQHNVLNGSFVTTVRQPVSHYLSFFYYMVEPDKHISLEQHVARGGGKDTMAADFMISSQEQLDSFLKVIKRNMGNYG